MSQDLTITIRAIDTGVEQTFQRLADAASRLFSSANKMDAGAQELHDLGSAADAATRNLANAEKSIGDIERAASTAATKTRDVGGGIEEMGTKAGMAQRGLSTVTGLLDGISRSGAGAGFAIGEVTKTLAGIGSAALTESRDLAAISSIYRDGAAAVEEYAQAFQNATTYSNDEARKAFITAGTLVNNYGFTAQQVNEVVQYSADLAIMYGYSLQDATQRVTAALRGEAESAEALGLTMNQSAIDSENLTQEMSNQEAAAFRLAALQEQVGFALGTAQGRADTLSGTMASLTNRFQDFRVAVGQQLGPVGEFAAVFSGMAMQLSMQLSGLGAFSNTLKGLPQTVTNVNVKFTEYIAKLQQIATAQKTIGNLTLPIGAVGIALTALVAVGTAVFLANKKQEQAAKDLAVSYDRLKSTILELNGAAALGEFAPTFDFTNMFPNLDEAMGMVQSRGYGIMGVLEEIGRVAGTSLPGVTSGYEAIALSTDEGKIAVDNFGRAFAGLGPQSLPILAGIAENAALAANTIDSGFTSDSFVVLSGDIATVAGRLGELRAAGENVAADAIATRFDLLTNSFINGHLSASDYAAGIKTLVVDMDGLGAAAAQAAEVGLNYIGSSIMRMTEADAEAIMLADELTTSMDVRRAAISALSGEIALEVLKQQEGNLTTEETLALQGQVAKEVLAAASSYQVGGAAAEDMADAVASGQMTFQEVALAMGVGTDAASALYREVLEGNLTIEEAIEKFRELSVEATLPGMDARALSLQADAIREIGVELGLSTGKTKEFLDRLRSGDDVATIIADMYDTVSEFRAELNLTGKSTEEMERALRALGDEAAIYALTQDDVLLTEAERTAALGALTSAGMQALLFDKDSNLTLEERKRLISEVASAESELARQRAKDSAQWEADSEKITAWYESEEFQRSPQGVEQTILALRDYDKYINLSSENVAKLTAEVREQGLTLDEAKAKADAMSEAQQAEADASKEAAEAFRETNDAAMALADSYRSALVPGIEGVSNAMAAFVTPGDTYLQMLAKMVQAGEVTGGAFIDVAAGIETSGAALQASLNQIASVDALGQASQSLVTLLDELVAAPGTLAPIDDWFANQIVRLEKTGQAYDELGNTTAAYNDVVGQYNALQQAQIDATNTNAVIQADLLDIKLGLIDTEVEQQQQLATYIASLKELAPEEQQRALYLMDSANQTRLATLQSTAYSVALGEIPSGVGTQIIADAAQADPVLADILEGMGLISYGAKGEIQVELPDADAAIIDKFAQMFPDAQVTKTTNGMISVVNSDGSEAVYTRFGDLVAQDGKRITATIALALDDFSGLMEAGGGGAVANSIAAQITSQAQEAISIPVEPMVRPGAADEAIANAFANANVEVDATANIVSLNVAVNDVSQEMYNGIPLIDATGNIIGWKLGESLGNVPVTAEINAIEQGERLVGEVPVIDATGKIIDFVMALPDGGEHPSFDFTGNMVEVRVTDLPTTGTGDSVATVPVAGEIDGEQVSQEINRAADAASATVQLAVELDDAAALEAAEDIADRVSEIDQQEMTVTAALNDTFTPAFAKVKSQYDGLNNDTLTVTARLDATAYASSLSAATRDGQAFGGRTFTAKLAGDAGNFNAAVSGASGQGQTFGTKTFTAKLAGDAGLFTTAISNASTAGTTFAGRTFIAKLSGDAALFNAAVATADGTGDSFAATTYAAKLDMSTTAYDQKLAAVRQTLAGLASTASTVRIDADTSPFNDDLGRLLGATLGTAYIRVEPVYVAAPPPPPPAAGGPLQPSAQLGGTVRPEMAERSVGLTPAGVFSTSVYADNDGAAMGRAVVVGEAGPEVAMLPFGSFVTNSTASRSRMQEMEDDRGLAVGQSLGDGFALGLDDRTGLVAAAAAGMAETAVMAMEQVLEIASPSFRAVEIGRDFGDGFAFGIEERSRVAERVAREIAKRTAEAAQETANRNPVTAPVIVAPQEIDAAPPAGVPPITTPAEPPPPGAPTATPPGAPTATPMPPTPPPTPPTSAPGGMPASVPATVETDWRGRPIRPDVGELDDAAADAAIAAYKQKLKEWKQAQQEAAKAAAEAAAQLNYDFYAGLVAGAQSEEALKYLVGQAQEYADTAIEAWRVQISATSAEIGMMQRELAALQQELAVTPPDQRKIIETQIAETERAIQKAEGQRRRMETVGTTAAAIRDLRDEMASADTGVYEDRAIRDQIAAMNDLKRAQQAIIDTGQELATLGDEEAMAKLADAAKTATGEYDKALKAYEKAVLSGDVMEVQAAAAALAQAEGARSRAERAVDDANAAYEAAQVEQEMNNVRLQEAQRAVSDAANERSKASSRDTDKEAYREEQRAARRAEREQARADAAAPPAAPPAAAPPGAGATIGEPVGSEAGAAIAEGIADGVNAGIDAGAAVATDRASEIAAIIDALNGVMEGVNGQYSIVVDLPQDEFVDILPHIRAVDDAMTTLGKNAPAVMDAMLAGGTVTSIVEEFGLVGKEVDAVKTALYALNEEGVKDIVTPEALDRIADTEGTLSTILREIALINQHETLLPDLDPVPIQEAAEAAGDLNINISALPGEEITLGDIDSTGIADLNSEVSSTPGLVDDANAALAAPTPTYRPAVDTGAVETAAADVADLDDAVNTTGTYTVKVNDHNLNVTIEKAAGAISTLGDNASGLATEGTADIGVFNDSVRATGRVATNAADTIGTAIPTAIDDANAAINDLSFNSASKEIDRGVDGAVEGIGEIPPAMTDVQSAAATVFSKIKETMTRNLGDGSKSGSSIVAKVLSDIDAEIAEPSVELSTTQFDRDVTQLGRDIATAERDDLNVEVRFDKYQVTEAWKQALSWMSDFDVTVSINTSGTDAALQAGGAVQAKAMGGTVTPLGGRNVLVGEVGPEVVTLPHGSYVTNSTGSRSRLAESSPGAVNIYAPVYITAATPDIAAEIRRQLAGQGRA